MGCMTATATREPTVRQTSTRSNQELGLELDDLSRKEYPAVGVKRYGIVFSDEFSRFM